MIVRKLSKAGKEAWSSILDAATNRSPSDDLAKTLVIIRNKVSFHYASRELARGYDYAFFQKPEDFGGKPFVSRGSTLIKTRFYFPDAAVQAYIRRRALASSVNDFLLGRGKLIEAINQALYELVTRFIQSRSAWQQYRAGA